MLEKTLLSLSLTSIKKQDYSLASYLFHQRFNPIRAHINICFSFISSYPWSPADSRGATGLISQLSYSKNMSATCLERVLNILYCSLIIAFPHCYLNAAPFMGSEKIPFTSSREQSGSLGCDVSCHLCAGLSPSCCLALLRGLIHWQAVALWY